MRPPAAIFQAEASTFRDLTLNPKPSSHEETDESRDAKEKEENDCPINRAKPCFFRVVGRDEHSIKNMALPAHVVSNSRAFP